MELKDKVIVVTGASSGIGEATARRLDKDGAKLVLVARSEDKLKKLAGELGDAKVAVIDATDDDAGERMVKAAEDAYGRVDGFINNAGMMVVGEVDEIDLKKARMMLRINTEAAIMGAMAFARHFKKQGSGHIITTTSIAGYKTSPGIGIYNATKFAMEAFSDALRTELAGTGVKVTAVAPGTVKTALYDDWKNDDAKGAVFAGGALEPAAIANVMYFALTRPDDVDVAKVLVVPPGQAV